MKAKIKDNKIIKIIADEKIAGMPAHVIDQFLDAPDGAKVGDLYEKKAPEKYSKHKNNKGE